MEKPHRQLKVWQRSVNFTVELYQITKQFPVEERFGLVAQMRRAAVSIPSNLAEGAARSRAEYAQFIRIAIGSVSELDSQLEICKRLNYLSNEQYQHLEQELTEIDRMLIGLRKAIVKTLKP